MWRRLRRVLRRLWHGPRSSPEDDGAAQARARFWAQVREGEREAEAHARR